MDLGEPVVYIDFEDSPATAIARLQSLGATDEQIGNLFTYIRPDTPATPDVVSRIPGIGATVIVIDGVTEAMTMHGLELKDNTDVAKFVELLPRPLARMGAAVVLVDHVAKAQEGRGRFAEGRRAYVIEALNTLVAEGYAERTTGDHGSFLYASIREFREES